MKRAGILGLAIVLTLGLAVSASQAAKSKKVDSEVEIAGWYYPEGEWTIAGDVHAKKNSCEKSRTVTILGLDSETDDGSVQGTATTDATGDWEFNLQNEDFTPYHAAEVARKKITKANGKKIVCKSDRSPAFYND